MKKSQREVVFNKYGGKCAYCGCDLQKGWHVDHLDPCRRITNRNGNLVAYINPNANHIDNLLPSCASCNINKHSDSLEQFRANIQGYLNSLNLRMVQYKMVKKYGLVEETGKQVVFYFETINPNHQ